LCIWRELRGDASIVIVGQLVRKSWIPGLSMIASDGRIVEPGGRVRKMTEDEYWEYVS
jgi:hypothetical protein